MTPKPTTRSGITDSAPGENHLTGEEFDQIVRPEKMTHP